MAKFIAFLAVAFQVLHVSAECPNACSAHGKCTQFDMCLCYRNWMSNDCSERTCQFGLAHVDSPKGDLDSSNGPLSGPGVNVVEFSSVYPAGTSEQFPQMIGTDDAVIDNTGHYYMECSNKGLCDRGAGVCECFPGYEGSACQRASCPVGNGGMCSGHGTCHTIREIADYDNHNIYELWDKHSSMGCMCDAGYSGPDCSDRACKYGIDPLYNDDDVATARVSNWTVNIFTTIANRNTNGVGSVVTGTYSLIFSDVFGEDWETVPISAGGWCGEVVAALESIPNNVIPLNSVLCLDNKNQPVDDKISRIPADLYDIHRSFILAFPQNPGKLDPIVVNFNLDGPRPTLTTDEYANDNSLRSLVFADGFSGEFVDNVPDLCEGVKVTLGYEAASAAYGAVGGFYLNGLDFRELAKLKRCLGDSDGITTQDNYEPDEVYNWDFGDFKHPHLIKLVDANRNVEVLLCNASNNINPDHKSDISGSSCQFDSPAGFYLPLWYDPTITDATENKKFRVIGTKGLGAYMTVGTLPTYGTATNNAVFNVFTTKGFLTSVNGFTDEDVSATHSVNSIYQKPITADDNSHLHWHNSGVALTAGTNTQAKRIDCETFKSTGYSGGASSTSGGQCLQKGDMVMFFDVSDLSAVAADNNDASGVDPAWPLQHNIYTVEKIFYDRDKVSSAGDFEDWTPQGSIVLDKEPNFFFDTNTIDLLAWKFQFPVQQDGYEYVSECSGRGLCSHDAGVCECFTGHTSDDCSVQNTLAK